VARHLTGVPLAHTNSDPDQIPTWQGMTPRRQSDTIGEMVREEYSAAPPPPWPPASSEKAPSGWPSRRGSWAASPRALVVSSGACVAPPRPPRDPPSVRAGGGSTSVGAPPRRREAAACLLRARAAPPGTPAPATGRGAAWSALQTAAARGSGGPSVCGHARLGAVRAPGRARPPDTLFLPFFSYPSARALVGSSHRRHVPASPRDRAL